MPDATRVLTALSNDLEARGLIRRPGNVGDLPPLFVEPAGGPPAPGDREGREAGIDLVVTIRLSGEAAEGPFDGYRRRIVVDAIYRSKGTAGLKGGRALDARIRRRLVEGPGGGLALLLDEGGPAATMVLSARAGGLGPVSDVAGVRTELAKYTLEVLAAEPPA